MVIFYILFLRSLLQLSGEGLVWLIGAVLCLLAADWVQLFADVGNGWLHSVLWHY